MVVLSNGSKYEGCVYETEYGLGDRVIRYGCEGNDVRLLQEKLLALGYDLGKWGVDGDFGDCTELALKAFQKDAKVDADGECGPITLAALEKALQEQEIACAQSVRIIGGNCYVRSAPNTSGRVLGVAHQDEVLAYGGSVSEAGWLQVLYGYSTAWVSGKYGRLE